jgi:hypothetical protein
MRRFVRTFWPWLLAATGYLAIWILISIPFDQVPVHIALLLLAFFAIQLTAVCFHEFGHLLACIILRELPALVEIGRGDILKQLRIGPIGFRFRATTNSGCVWSRHHLENFNRADMSVLYAAGPIVDFALVAAVLWFLANPPESVLNAPQFDYQVKPLLIMTAAYIFCYQLWYLFHRSSYSPGQHTDAGGLAALWPLLDAPTNVRRGYIRAANDVVDGEFVQNDESRPRAEESSARSDVDSSSGDGDDLLNLNAYYLWLLARPNLSSDYTDHLKDAFITNVLLHNLTDQLPLADRYSAELLAKAPDNITYAGGRGSVLVALGQIDAGKPLLESCYAQSGSATDRSISASFLALAEHRSGNPAAAIEWLDKAVAANPNCPSVKLAKAQFRSV